MGKCLSKDKGGGVSAPATAPEKPTGTSGHITVRELQRERITAADAGKEAAPVRAAALETPFKNTGLKDEQYQDAVPDIVLVLGTGGVQAGVAAELDLGTEDAGGLEKQPALPSDHALKGQSLTGCRPIGGKNFHSRRPLMSSSEFAGHFSDFNFSTGAVVDAEAITKNAGSPVEDVTSPSSSPVKSVKESTSVKASVSVKRTPTKTELKPTKTGRYALKDISSNAPLNREQGLKRQLPKLPVIQSSDTSQDAVIFNEDDPKSITADFERSRSGKRSRDLGTQPNEVAVITSLDVADKQAQSAPAVQDTTSLDVSNSSYLRGNLSVPVRHDEIVRSESNTSMSTTQSTSSTISSHGLPASTVSTPPSTTAGSREEGWLIPSLVSDQDECEVLLSEDLGSLEFTNLDGLPQTSQLVLEVNREKATPFQDVEEPEKSFQMNGSSYFPGGDQCDAEAAPSSLVDENTSELHPSKEDGNEGRVNVTLLCDSARLLVHEVGGSNAFAGDAELFIEGASFEASSVELALDDGEQEHVEFPRHVTQGKSCDGLSIQIEPVSSNESPNPGHTSPSDGEHGNPEQSAGNAMDSAATGKLCEEVPTGETVNAEVSNGVDEVGDHVCDKDMENEDLNAGCTVSKGKQSLESSIESPSDNADKVVVSEPQLDGRNLMAQCTEKVSDCGSAAASSADPDFSEIESLEAQSKALKNIKMVDVHVTGRASFRKVSSSQIEGLELAIEVVNNLDERAGSWSVDHDVQEVAKQEVWSIVPFLSLDDASTVNHGGHDSGVQFATAPQSVTSGLQGSTTAFAFPLEQCEVAEGGQQVDISTTEANSGKRISCGAFGSPFKEYMSSSSESDEVDHFPVSDQANGDDSTIQKPEEPVSTDNRSLGSGPEMQVSSTVATSPVDTGRVVTADSPRDTLSRTADGPPSEPIANATSTSPPLIKIPLQASSDNFLVKLPPVSKRTSVPSFSRPPRPEKRITDSQVADLLSSFNDRPQRLSSSAPSSPQGPIFDLSQYSLPSTPGDSCPRRSSVDSRGSEGPILDLSQFSLSSTPLSMSARSSPMSHSSTPRKLGHANAIALTAEEIAEIWGAFEQGSH